MNHVKTSQANRLILSATLTALTFSIALANDAQAGSKRLYRGGVSASVAMADKMMMKGKYADATTYYQKALKANPHDVNANVGYGMALEKQFKIDGADDQFNKALARDANNPGAHAGKALNMLNRLQSSSNTIRKSRDSILNDAQAEAQKALDADKRIP
jgi:Flp pilus assembly protein TadD